MSTIFERLEKKLDNLEKNAEKRAEKKVRHQKLSEMFYGKDWVEKATGIIKIISA